jgi:hypothetical protein
MSCAASEIGEVCCTDLTFFLMTSTKFDMTKPPCRMGKIYKRKSKIGVCICLFILVGLIYT